MTATDEHDLAPASLVVQLVAQVCRRLPSLFCCDRDSCKEKVSGLRFITAHQRKMSRK